jgi:hypothetical protein
MQYTVKQGTVYVFFVITVRLLDFIIVIECFCYFPPRFSPDPSRILLLFCVPIRIGTNIQYLNMICCFFLRSSPDSSISDRLQSELQKVADDDGWAPQAKIKLFFNLSVILKQVGFQPFGPLSKLSNLYFAITIQTAYSLNIAKK